jgi:endothelin-converting enzyme/putative endopeptidase
MRLFGLMSALGLFVCSSLLSQNAGGSSGVDIKSIDPAVNPCQNFYLYACGGWKKANPIPPQYSRWGRFNELAERNQKILRAILEDSAQHPERSAVDQKIGAFYGACMNESVIDNAGYSPIKPALERIQGLASKDALAAEVARFHNQGVDAFFRFTSTPDPDNAHTTIADVDQGGLGMPDKSYYLEEKDDATRQKYLALIAKMFQLTGLSQSAAEAKAKAVVALETTLARASLDRTARRNPHLLHNKMTVAQLAALAPDFDFKQYFNGRAAPAFDSLNVSVPDFFKNLGTAISASSLDDLKSYLSWHYINNYASELSKPFVEADFDFYQRYLNGAQELQPRWKRCVQLTDRSLGDAVGQKYVEKAFSGQSKERTRELVALIEKEMAADIDSLTWMTETTKEQALAKLKGVTNKIGYPEKWKNYSTVSINDHLVADVRDAREFEIHRTVNKIGKPVDRSEFGMTPPTVNAYYSPSQNNINFPAGILQPPFYTAGADMAENFGGIGAVIGHELTHGFDDQGRQFDADGNLRDWWTAKDAEEFKKRADCIANEYSGFSPVEGVNLNGRLTLGENGADNAGIRLAFMALMSALADGSVSKEKLDGFTAQQRFFLGYAQIWCQNERPEAAKTMVRTDPHSPGEFRVDGVVQNMPEFANAFSCSEGQPMVSAKACRVW